MKKHICFILLIITIPYGLCLLFDIFCDNIRIGQGDRGIESHLLNKSVLLEMNGLYKSMDVEEYILGVLPGTIPADYDEEALKVQAILIRTNVLKEMEEKGTSDAADLSYHYLTVEERIDLFGERNYERYQERFERAVVDTAGMVLRQEGNLIMALYHEVSIGKTISGKELLGEDIAYLQSVDSSQDVEAKHYMNVVNYTWAELQELLQGSEKVTENEATTQENAGTAGTEAGTQVNAGTTSEETADGAAQDETQATGGVTKSATEGITESATKGATKGATEDVVEEAPQVAIKVEESTENGYVVKASVDGTIYTGEELAEKLKLSSTNFYVEEIDGGLRLVCLGKGSGLGVSQYGANRMALEGKKAEEIIRYYLQKVSVEKY